MICDDPDCAHCAQFRILEARQAELREQRSLEDHTKKGEDDDWRIDNFDEDE